jgi:hypothetical protein
MKRKLLLVNHVLIALFAISSGAVKLMPHNPDLAVFAKLGMGAMQVAIFGVLQALAGLALLPKASRSVAATVVVACNAFATVGLFIAGIQPFGVISIVFVLMAAIELVMSPPAPSRAIAST